MPLLPEQLFVRFIDRYGLCKADVMVLTEEKGIALFFDTLCQATTHYKAAANWMMGPVKSWLNEHKESIEHFPLTPVLLAQVVEMVVQGELSFGLASTTLFLKLIENQGGNPRDLAKQLGLLQVDNQAQLATWIKEALACYPEKVIEYRNGKKGVVALFMGEVMRLSKRKAHPRKAMVQLKEALEKPK